METGPEAGTGGSRTRRLCCFNHSRALNQSCILSLPSRWAKRWHYDEQYCEQASKAGWGLCLISSRVSGRTCLSARDDGRLAKAIQSMPGWSLDLVLVPEPERLDSPEGARTLEAGRAQRIKDGRRACLRPHLLLAWSACEASAGIMLLGADVSNTSTGACGLPRRAVQGRVHQACPGQGPGFGCTAIGKGVRLRAGDELLDLARRMAVQADDALADLEAPA